MKTSFLTWTAALVAVSALVACGDDSATDSSGSGSGGAGGAGTGTGPTTGPTTGPGPGPGPGPTTGPTTGTDTTTSTSTDTTTSTSTDTTTSTSTGEGGNGGSGGGTGGSEPTCDDTSDLGTQSFIDGDGAGFMAWGGPLDPFVVDVGDGIQLELYQSDVFNGFDLGTFDLTENGDDNYASCSRCFRAFLDVNSEAPLGLFQDAGTLTINSIDLATGTIDYEIEGLNLIEVTIDPGTFESTPVDGGACVGIGDAAVVASPPQICESGLSGGSEEVDACLEADPGACDAFEACTGTQSEEDIGACVDCILAGGGALCDDALAIIHDTNCFTPPDDVWTCEDDAYWDGATCDCACGTGDPDCDIVEDPLPVEGCDAGEICSEGACVPEGWTCSGAFYDAADGCDCECGIPDPDCDDPDQAVLGCDAGQICNDEALCEDDFSGCASATLVLDDFSGDTTNGDIGPAGSCSISGLSEAFTFTALATGEHTFTLTSATDQGISVRTTCNDNESELGCVDIELGGTDEVLVVDLTLAQTVTILVSPFTSGSEGPYDVAIDAP